MKFLIFFLILFLSLSFPALAMEKIFYLTNEVNNTSLVNPKILEDIQNHAKSIDILAPQIYSLDVNGHIFGHIDTRLLEIAKKNSIKLFPLITNSNFDPNIIHEFLKNSNAQKKAISNILDLCNHYQFYGVQFDIENINIKDKDALSHFVELASQKLHNNHYHLSITIVAPLYYNKPNPNDYEKWYLENWSGAYDYFRLANVTDFITIMSYDLHTSLTGPGPIAPIDWVRETIKILLKNKVLPNKISLGIPLYSAYWSPGIRIKEANQINSPNAPFHAKESQITFEKLSTILKNSKCSLIWDDQTKSAYSILKNNYLYEYVFAENAQSFDAKLYLVQQYHLRGFSAWQLGLEDPKIWQVK